MQCETPVLLVVFNRPDMASAVMKALQHAKPKHLLISADGSRATRQGEQALCAHTREIVRAMIDWQCEVHWRCPEGNLGCGQAVSTAIMWALEKFEEVIVLEDDCVPHPEFFGFVRQMLTRYRHEQQVMLVSGINVLRGRYRLPYSYGFSRYPLTWGWATWRRAWKYFDFGMTAWPAVRDGDVLVNMLGNRREAQYWTRNFELIRNGQLDTWDYQLHLTMWSHGMYALYPAANLINNIGVQGVHFSGNSPMHNLPYEALESPLRHPPTVYRDLAADDLICRTWYLPSFGDKVLKKLRRVAPLTRMLTKRIPPKSAVGTVR